MSSPPYSLQPPTPPLQHHCFHCSNDWWPRTFTRPQRCPRCQCKFWNIPHYQGLHPRRQGNLRLPAQPPGQPPEIMTAAEHTAALDAVDQALAAEEKPSADPQKGEPCDPTTNESPAHD